MKFLVGISQSSSVLCFSSYHRALIAHKLSFSWMKLLKSLYSKVPFQGPWPIVGIQFIGAGWSYSESKLYGYNTGSLVPAALLSVSSLSSLFASANTIFHSWPLEEHPLLGLLQKASRITYYLMFVGWILGYFLFLCWFLQLEQLPMLRKNTVYFLVTA